ncbi:DUF1684 domain-containing protein [Corynebacterium nuruki]|uniref:DUF1684 domain-containing protein n=1 Tax=Corynebacterium nuruki TaxID=1032851 RepID=UPI0002485C94|nr:DUF1684 domain-containing protein [Corynebacterium nuruki]
MTTATSQSWKTWHTDRIAAVTAPDGAAALTGTHWIHATGPDDAVEVPGVPGRWYIDGDGDTVAVTGTGLPDGWTTPVRLAPGDRVSDGGLTLVGHARAGDAALRVFDATAGTRTSVSGIEVFDHDPAWEVTAHFVADPATVTVTSADGFEAPGSTAGRLEFTLPDGTSHSLRVTDADGGFFVSFSDAGRAAGTHAFRFLHIPAPDADGNTVIDFNRAELPAFAFSGAFHCPLPSAANLLDVPVPAGERRVARFR